MTLCSDVVLSDTISGLWFQPNIKRSNWIPSPVLKTFLFIIANWLNTSLAGNSQCLFFRSLVCCFTHSSQSWSKTPSPMTRLLKLSLLQIFQVIFRLVGLILHCISQPAVYQVSLKFRSRDPCQVWYICGFHRMAQHDRLQMCVKSLLDGRRQPQWLTLMLQRPRQNHTAASVWHAASEQVWNGQQ